jgi:hypothetical protein
VLRERLDVALPQAVRVVIPDSLLAADVDAQPVVFALDVAQLDEEALTVDPSLVLGVADELVVTVGDAVSDADAVRQPLDDCETVPQLLAEPDASTLAVNLPERDVVDVPDDTLLALELPLELVPTVALE